jgi:hypothetical protein
MPGKTDKARKAAARRRLAKKIEQIIFDYVYDSFGPSEAEDPSWYIPELAEYVANALSAQRYKPIHKIAYEEN